MEEDDFFADDDLENIPDDTLQELEQNAWSSTQKQIAIPAAALRKQAHNASSLNRSSNQYKNLPWRPPQRSQPQPTPASTAHAVAAADREEESLFDEYGLDDEVVIDLNDQSTTFPPYSHSNDVRPDSHAQSRSRTGTKSPPDSQTEAAYAAADAELSGGLFPQPKHAGHGGAGDVDGAKLRARIAQLEVEQTRLRKVAQEARNATLAKQGEIAIVRANQKKTNEEYERRIVALQKQHADESVRHRAELDVRGKEMEKMQTDNRFLQHEAAQEVNRAKRRNGPVKPRTAPASRETPRKSRTKPLGDGFDDDEVYQASPSRSRDKSRDDTSKVGAKRKRPAPDSPGGPLAFAQSLRHESSENVHSVSDSFTVEDAARYEDTFNDFMPRLLGHMSLDGQTSAIEALTRYSFPSSPDKSISSLFMDEVTAFLASDSDDLSMDLCQALLRLWGQCLTEAYFAPFALILDLLRFILRFELADFVSELIEQAVPLCSRSVDLITINITTAAVYPSYEQHVDWAAHEKLAEEVDSVEVLEFLLTLCRASSISAHRIESFWRKIEGTFVFTLLSKALPISHISIALQMLKTSVLSMTFGPICNDAELQSKQEHGAVERLTNLLFEIPRSPGDEPEYSEEELCELRIEVLEVLQQICLTDHGDLLIACHRSALGRLIRFLDRQICKLYETRPSIGLLDFENSSEPGRNTHDLIVKTVNLTTRIFYHVLRTHDSSIDVVQKLSMVQGGYHKFLVCLTRIAFSDQLVFEAGIEEEVIDAAHTILDNFLGPEDGEAIKKAVETPRGTRGSTTEKDTTSGEQTIDEEDTMMSDVIG